MASVLIKNLVKRYNDLEVVHGINLDIQSGEFIVLVGPSGCGKSTTLRMIAGLEEISSGEIQIEDKVVNDVPPKDRNISMVFQNYALYPHMSVYENMSFSLRLKNRSKNEIDQAVQAAAKILGLGDYLARKPNELSGGQRQRVAMGRAIVRQPKVFLFDEPLSNLDAKLRTEMRAEIKRLHQRMNTTIVYVTHDQVEAMTLADRIVIMNKGNIEQVGTPGEIYSQPQNTFVANFIGSPPMNMISSGEFLSGWKEKNLPDKITRALDLSAIIGIRPEHLSLNSSQGLPLNGVVEFIEPLGGETLFHLKVNGGNSETVSAKIPSEQISKNIKIGEALELFVAPEKVTSFDKNTHKVL